MRQIDMRWLEHYPEHVPHRLPPGNEHNLLDMIDESCRRYGGRSCLRSFGGRLSYEQLHQYSHYCAAWFRQKGLTKGDKVALIMPNIMQFVVGMTGILRAGGVVVTVNPLYTSRELQQILQDARPCFVFVASPFVPVLARISLPDSIKAVIITQPGDLQSRLRALFINNVARWRQKSFLRPALESVRTVPFQQLLDKGREAFLRRQDNDFDIKPQDVAFMLYTGGTTGVPKGVLLSHANLLANLEQVAHWVGERLRPGQETVLTALPLYHIFSLTGNCLLFLKLGGTNVLIADARKTKDIIHAFKKYKISAFTGVNTLFMRLLDHPDFQRLKFDHLRLVIGGGTAVSAEVAQRWEQLTRQPLLQAYGLTETSPAVCINPTDGRHINTSIGLPLTGTEVVICDADGRHLAPDHEGEICVRGPQVMLGYHQQEQANRAAFFPGGYFRTGDVGYMDSAGFVYLRERQADIINVSGFNVYPSEIEAVIGAYPGVSAVAAVGMPCSQAGQSVKVFVQASDPDLTVEQLQKHCAQQLAQYKCPREIVFCQQLPISHVGKVLRRALRGD